MAEYYLTIGPIEDDPDGISPQDHAETLESQGWRKVKVEWVGQPTVIAGCGCNVPTQWNHDNDGKPVHN